MWLAIKVTASAKLLLSSGYYIEVVIVPTSSLLSFSNWQFVVGFCQSVLLISPRPALFNRQRYNFSLKTAP
jgi:hypothetical protein